jgi:hypothetical protein
MASNKAKKKASPAAKQTNVRSARVPKTTSPPGKAKTASPTRNNKKSVPKTATILRQEPIEDEELKEGDDEEEAEALIVDTRTSKRGRLKDDDDFPSEDENADTEEEEIGNTSSPAKKKKKKPKLDATAKLWKDRAKRAERQLTSITQTRVVNAFQEGEVRQYAKQVMWKKVKFITCDGTMVRCMKEAALAFQVKESDQEDWMSTYSHCVREAINAQRNHCCQELRKVLLSKYCTLGTLQGFIDANILPSGARLLTTEMRNEKHEDYVDDVTLYADVRDSANLVESYVPFWTFFDKFVPCIAGVKIWATKVKTAKTITDSGCVTITDEAFTILALENYWDRWFHNTSAKWTDSRRGNQQFMGWSDEAYDRYDDTCRRIKKQRDTQVSQNLEKSFRSWLAPGMRVVEL